MLIIFITTLFVDFESHLALGHFDSLKLSSVVAVGGQIIFVKGCKISALISIDIESKEDFLVCL